MSIKKPNLLLILIALLILSCTENAKNDMPLGTKVVFKKEGESYQLYRNGKPYYIKGAAGHEHLDQVKACGGNSIRTWGGEKNIKEILDTAWKHGLSVTVGLYVAPLRHDFDYNNKEAVEEQYLTIKKTITELKDHPAVLMWGLGNELEHMPGNREREIPLMYKSVNEIARMIHETDPNHPVATMIVPYRKTIRNINKYCPEIDVLGFNCFSGLHELKAKINTPYFGWSKPYIVSEWGSPGWWEVENTLWDVPIEETSTVKAALFKDRYEKYILPEKDQCAGSYVFYWGFKQEKTATWFSMFDAEGNRSETVNTMKYLWTGEKNHYNPAPQLNNLTLDNKKPEENLFLPAGTIHTLKAEPAGASAGELTVLWEIKPENETEGYWGENEKAAPAALSRKGQNLLNLEFKTPDKEGPYRAYCYIYDKNGSYATANFPFYVLEYGAEE